MNLVNCKLLIDLVFNTYDKHEHYLTGVINMKTENLINIFDRQKGHILEKKHSEKKVHQVMK